MNNATIESLLQAAAQAGDEATVKDCKTVLYGKHGKKAALKRLEKILNETHE
jgi:hypothetical protein